MPAKRDPVSELLDRGARVQLARAYAAPIGTWVMTRLADPSEDHLRWAAAIGVGDLMGPDRPGTLSGTHVQAHTRWGRAFMRALWYQHKWFGDRAAEGFRDERRMMPLGTPLQVEWGRRMPRRGIIPPGRAVRIRIPSGADRAIRVVQGKPDSERIFDNEGTPAGRWSDPALRDWA